ncbi:hypothetical protein, partial [Achromobacter marplatensis]|uniref:hypothetical protein n=1 Tax=Achromobacter marplatensis TaxID=470868 RepID=UPI000277F4A5
RESSLGGLSQGGAYLIRTGLVMHLNASLPGNCVQGVTIQAIQIDALVPSGRHYDGHRTSRAHISSQVDALSQALQKFGIPGRQHPFTAILVGEGHFLHVSPFVLQKGPPFGSPLNLTTY